MLMIMSHAGRVAALRAMADIGGLLDEERRRSELQPKKGDLDRTPIYVRARECLLAGPFQLI